MKIGFKVLMGAIGSIALGFASVGGHAATPSNSPLLGHSQGSQNAVRELIGAMQDTEFGPINASNIGLVVDDVVGKFPSHSTDQWAGALNELGLSKNTLAVAINALSDGLKVPSDTLITALIVNTYTTMGREQAQAQVDNLRVAMGGQTVDMVMFAAINNELMPEAGISSAADATQDDVLMDLYNG